MEIIPNVEGRVFNLKNWEIDGIINREIDDFKYRENGDVDDKLGIISG